MSTTTNTTPAVDLSRGVDVFRGSKLLRHFEGADAYTSAKAYAQEGHGRYIRYWGLKPQAGEEA